MAGFNKESLSKLFSAVKSSPDKALGKAVKRDDLAGVRKAFDNGASANAMHSIYDWDSWNAPLLGTRLIEPVLVTALYRSSAEVVEEILKHKPDKTLEATPYLKYDLLETARKVVSFASIKSEAVARMSPPSPEAKLGMVEDYVAGREVKLNKGPSMADTYHIGKAWKP